MINATELVLAVYSEIIIVMIRPMIIVGIQIGILTPPIVIAMRAKVLDIGILGEMLQMELMHVVEMIQMNM